MIDTWIEVCMKYAVAVSALSLSLKTVAVMEGCTWSAVFSTSEKSRTLGSFSEGAFWWQKAAGQYNWSSDLKKKNNNNPNISV